jgi:hypothetical protein
MEEVALSHLASICFLSNYVVNLNFNLLFSRSTIVVNIDINLVHFLFDFIIWF